MLRTTIRDVLSVDLVSSGDYGNRFSSLFPLPDLLWGDGSGPDQNNLFWEDIDATLANGATRNLDLRALTGGPNGSTPDMRDVRYLEIKSDKPLLLEVGAANGWTALGADFSIVIPANVWVRLVGGDDPCMVTGAADKVIDITNDSGALATYSIIILGTNP